MTGSVLRPGADGMLRAWKGMIRSEAAGAGFDLEENRQTRFSSRVRTFLDGPCEDSFADLWQPDAVVAHDNPGTDLFLTTFDGDVDDLAAFVETLRTADAFDPTWSDRLGWRWALWELYTRCNDSAPVVLTEESVEALEWFGIAVSGSFRERVTAAEGFRERYADVVGHATAGTAHEVPVRVEIDQLCNAVVRLGPEDIAAQLKGPHGQFYRHLYGGREAPAERTDQVELVEETRLVYAYAWGKKKGAYEDERRTDFWGGSHWEDWKDEYAAYFDDTIRERYALADLEPDDVAPLFDDITNRDATDLGASVAEYLMGGRWGQYVWNDVVDYFVSNPGEASDVLSLFFDDSVHVSDRLRAFREHTIHISDEEGRSPGSIERMATSLLMLASPDDHVGLPPRKTSVLLEDKSTLSNYRSGFRPRQYWAVIHALRALRDEIATALEELGEAGDATMLDVHNVIWIYEESGDPHRGELPPSKR